MAFDVYEEGDGSPVELITFQSGPVLFKVSNTVFPYVAGASTFEPLAYTLSPFAQSKDSDDNNRTMRVPNNFGVVNLFTGVLTSNLIQVTIERVHIDDGAQQRQILWKGRIVAVNHVDGEVELLLQPNTSGKESTPPDTYSGQCNSFLFDSPGCNLARDDWRHVGVVSSILNGGINLTIGGLRTQAEALDASQAAVGSPGGLSSAELDVYWQGGYIVTADGEVRDIVEGNVGTDPNVVRLVMPLRNLTVLDTVTVYAGCNLLRSTCHRKFDNVINFQGYPDIPEIDPANTELPSGTRTSRTPFAGAQN